jgi:hypothetical protein
MSSELVPRGPSGSQTAASGAGQSPSSANRRLQLKGTGYSQGAAALRPQAPTKMVNGKRVFVPATYTPSDEPPKTWRPSSEDPDGSRAIYLASGTIFRGGTVPAGSAPKNAEMGLDLLRRAVATSRMANRSRAHDALANLDMAVMELSPLWKGYEAVLMEQNGGTWPGVVDVRAAVKRVNITLHNLGADDRIDRTIMVPGQSPLTISRNKSTATSQKKKLLKRTLLPRAIKTLQDANEKLFKVYKKTKNITDDQIQLAFAGAFDSRPIPEDLKGALKAGNFVKAGNILNGLGAIVDMTDAEFTAKLKGRSGFFGNARNIGEVTEKAIQIVGLTIGGTAAFAEITFRSQGNVKMAMQMSGLAGKTFFKIGAIAGHIQLVTGVMTLFDPNASAAEKEDAAFSVFSSITGTATAKIAGATAGAAIGVALAVAWVQFKFLMGEMFKLKLAFAQAGLVPAFKELGRVGNIVATDTDRLLKASALAKEERLPDRRAALERRADHHEKRLRISVESFLQALKRTHTFHQENVGDHPILVKKFSALPVAAGKLLRRETRDDTVRAAVLMFEGISDVLGESNKIIQDAALGGSK